MRKLLVFESVTTNGYFAGPNGELDWAYAASDPGFDAFVKSNASGDGDLLFGRVTYDMMVSYWPTPMARQDNAEVAKGMNSARKYVFSKSLKEADWSNTTVVATDPAEFVRALKQEPGNDLVVLGSGSIVRQLADASLVDTYQLVVKSVALPAGKPLFDGMRQPLKLALVKEQAFGRSNVVLTYAPA